MNKLKMIFCENYRQNATISKMKTSIQELADYIFYLWEYINEKVQTQKSSTTLNLNKNIKQYQKFSQSLQFGTKNPYSQKVLKSSKLAMRDKIGRLTQQNISKTARISRCYDTLSKQIKEYQTIQQLLNRITMENYYQKQKNRQLSQQLKKEEKIILKHSLRIFHLEAQIKQLQAQLKTQKSKSKRLELQILTINQNNIKLNLAQKQSISTDQQQQPKQPQQQQSPELNHNNKVAQIPHKDDYVNRQLSHLQILQKLIWLTQEWSKITPTSLQWLTDDEKYETIIKMYQYILHEISISKYEDEQNKQQIQTISSLVYAELIQLQLNKDKPTKNNIYKWYTHIMIIYNKNENKYFQEKITLMNNIAILHEQQMKNVLSIQNQYLQIIKLQEKYYSKSDKRIIITKNNLACLYGQAKRIDEALDIFKSCLDMIQRESMGDEIQELVSCNMQLYLEGRQISIRLKCIF